MSEQPTVTCQICRIPMTPQPFDLDLGPGAWRPADERLAAILSKFFRCRVCGGVTIRPGVVRAAEATAA
jgi:hypothetical protein